jgi:hypothetical protein
MRLDVMIPMLKVFPVLVIFLPFSADKMIIIWIQAETSRNANEMK